VSAFSVLSVSVPWSMTESATFFPGSPIFPVPGGGGDAKGRVALGRVWLEEHDSGILHALPHVIN